MAIRLSEVFVEIGAKTSKFNSAIGKADSRLAKFGGRLKGLAQENQFALAALGVAGVLAFKLIVYQAGIVQSIQAGSFRLSPSQSTKEIELSLTEGRLDSWITIPEGFRNEEIAQLAGELFGIDKKDFLNEAEGL